MAPPKTPKKRSGWRWVMVGGVVVVLYMLYRHGQAAAAGTATAPVASGAVGAPGTPVVGDTYAPPGGWPAIPWGAMNASLGTDSSVSGSTTTDPISTNVAVGAPVAGAPAGSGPTPVVTGLSPFEQPNQPLYGPRPR